MQADGLQDRLTRYCGSFSEDLPWLHARDDAPAVAKAQSLSTLPVSVSLVLFEPLQEEKSGVQVRLGSSVASVVLLGQLVLNFIISGKFMDKRPHKTIEVG